jgi:hypothetical protein
MSSLQAGLQVCCRFVGYDDGAYLPNALRLCPAVSMLASGIAGRMVTPLAAGGRGDRFRGRQFQIEGEQSSALASWLGRYNTCRRHRVLVASRRSAAGCQ